MGSGSPVFFGVPNGLTTKDTKENPRILLRVPSCPLWLMNLAHYRNRAVLIEGGFQIGGDGSGIAGLDLMAVHHVNRFAVAQNGNGRRRWRISGEIGPRSCG